MAHPQARGVGGKVRPGYAGTGLTGWGTYRDMGCFEGWCVLVCETFRNVS